MKSFRRSFAVVFAIATASIAVATPAHAAGFLAGAGEESTTPPFAGTPAGDAADSRFAPAFASLCQPAVFPSRGRFALQEPFNDQNGNGQWDANVDLTGNPPSGPPEPFCDANGNGRWDGIYADNGKGPATGVHDGLDVRAVAISDGHDRPVVYVSVDQIGIFDYYTEDARADLANTYHVNADLVVSADHNESSPDSIGLYGAGQTPLGVGVRSGIDEYYMSFLDDKIAHAAADAVANLQPASLYANQVEGTIPAGQGGNHYPLLTGMSQRISDQFPTSVALPTDDRVAAVDTKLGVLQARSANGPPIFTVVNIAAHNQEMGNSGEGLSADWPGALEQSFEQSHPGLAMFLVGDNGSEEDPQTEPTVIPNGSENHSDQATQYIQAQATGARFAQIAGMAAGGASKLTPGTVKLTRKQICVPLENNGFLALAAAGEFGKRQGYVCDQNGNPVAPVPNGSITPTSSTSFRTFVGYTDIGPDMQFVDNPGEAFPALMLGSPFGVEDESCARPNPAVPIWHARALYRFNVGLADDLLGYLIPAWAFASGTPGLFNNDTCYQDQHGHGHKLESESVGPTGANDVANSLASMLDAEKDPSAHVAQGRFVLADGSYSRWPTGARGILIPAAGASALDPNGGTLIGAPDTAGFGRRAADATGVFMDYDGQPQGTPDVTTRGMMLLDRRGCVMARYYLDVFPTLDTSKSLAGAVSQPPALPSATCPVSDQGGVPELQPGAANRAGLGHGRGCHRAWPTSAVARRRLHRGVLTLSGHARAFRCAGRRARVARVSVVIVRRLPHNRCRYVMTNGRLSAKRDCGHQLFLLARGRKSWTLHVHVHLPQGHYMIIVRALDTHDLLQPERGRHADVTYMHVR